MPYHGRRPRNAKGKKAKNIDGNIAHASDEYIPQELLNATTRPPRNYWTVSSVRLIYSEGFTP
jgi:hypothetical protein